ncbi:MAG: bifunctional 4-hydroxy-3-methylbut-2-enyl diphosphate reductase/30S ribosomal protein S1, partial [Clostridia bacterium]|nr:bifunctional 4-hydroxy-3-methylbut-2-enyl diphosphate reductase/30S ribosomal protein S1 [Clostridia bacterium]
MIRIAQNAGFCKGVQRAFDMAIELSEKYDRVYTLGELVHNENVTEFLKSKRVFCVKDEDFDTLKEGDVALIRAHGISRETEAELRAKGVILFD